eukprot:7926965-Lingulodinium_polyedra.AAC.1
MAAKFVLVARPAGPVHKRGVPGGTETTSTRPNMFDKSVKRPHRRDVVFGAVAAPHAGPTIFNTRLLICITCYKLQLIIVLRYHMLFNIW